MSGAVMETAGSGVLAVAIWIAFALLLTGVALAAVRAVRGPTLPDRVVGLDTVTTLLVAFAGLFAIETGEDAFLDIALALALVAFLTTIAFARFVERTGLRTSDAHERDDER
jgi:multicomponent Na+:H+ antiporter subunit F